MAKRRRPRRKRWITNATGRRGERRSARSGDRERSGRFEDRDWAVDAWRAPRASKVTRRAEAGLERHVRRSGGVSARPEPDCSASMLRSKRRADAHLSARKFVATERDILACLPSAYGDEVRASPALGRDATRPTRAPKTPRARPGGALSAKVFEGQGHRAVWRAGEPLLSVSSRRTRTFRSPPTAARCLKQKDCRGADASLNQKPQRNQTLHPAPQTPAGRTRSPRCRRR